MHKDKHNITSRILLIETHDLNLIMKTQTKPKWRDTSAKYLACSLQKPQHRGKQDRLRNCFRFEGTKEIVLSGCN